MTDGMQLDWELIHDLRRMFKAGAKIPQLVDEIRHRVSVSSTSHVSVPLSNPFIPILYFVKAFCLSINNAKELGSWSRYLAGHRNDEEINDALTPLIVKEQSKWDAQS